MLEQSSFFFVSLSLTIVLILLFEKILQVLVQREYIKSFIANFLIVYAGVALIFRFLVENICCFGFFDLRFTASLELSGFVLSAVAIVFFALWSGGTRNVGAGWKKVVMLGPVLSLLSLVYVYIYSREQFFDNPWYVPFMFFSFGVIMSLLFGLTGHNLRLEGRRTFVLAYVAAFGATAVSFHSLVATTRMVFDQTNVWETVTIIYGGHSIFSFIVLAAVSIGQRTPSTLKTGITSTGLKVLDQLLPEGFPYPGAYAVLGPAGSGRTYILSKIAATRLKDGDGVLFFSVDQPSSVISSILNQMYAGSGTAVDEGRLRIIDFSGTGSFSLNLNPQDISIALTEYVNKLKSLRRWVFIDSFTTLLDEFGPDKAIKLLRTFVQKAFKNNLGLFISFNPYAFSRNITAMVEDCVNGVIEIIAEERRQKRIRKIRVKWMSGYKISGEWVTLQEL